MKEILTRYLDPCYVYRFTQGPDVVRTIEDARRDGINCISLAHLALRDLFGQELSPRLMCLELFVNRSQFEEVKNIDSAREGDLIWFGLANPSTQVADFRPVYKGDYLANWPDFPVKHVAIHTGQTTEDGQPVLLHASAVERTNVLWPLDRFAQYDRYTKVYGITRFRTD